MNRITIGIFAGSLRQDSYSKKVANYLADLLSEQFDVSLIDISSLAMYNEDLDTEGMIPEEWTRFRQEVKALDAVLFVTPEYNRSLPAVLKNAIDVASRPKNENAWGGKPGAVVGVSPGNIGGFGAGQHLRQVASCLNIYMMQQPEAYIGGIAGSVNDDNVFSESLQGFLSKIAGDFAKWVNIFAK